jgi:hypothetical protein
MLFKKSRFGPRLVAAAREGARYRDVHVFIGGTGAVGGAAALQMVAMFEEMMTIAPPASPDDVPVLIVTGRSDDEVHTFESRLKRFTRSRWGAGTTPRHFEHGFLTPGGVYVAVSKFELEPIRGLKIVTDADKDSQATAVNEFLQFAGVSNPDQLVDYVRATRPVTAFLEDRKVRLRDYGDKPFRSVLLGFPLPSILAYQTGGLGIVAQALGLGAELITRVRDEFENAFADDLVAVREQWGARVLVAHTTGVGGMYDETPDGHTTPRLGFAHAARDEALRQKHIEAEHLMLKYAQRGVLMLVTAAAIGIDEVRMREPIPLHGGIVKALRDAKHELFRGARERKQFIRLFKPITLRLDHVATAAPSGRDAAEGSGTHMLHFKLGDEIHPEYAIRSGENGFFSVANADALYRVMKVASVSELGHVLASVGLLGDDPNVPWFEDSICYYTETANSKQVFDFLYQPVLLNAQLSGIDPMALQDLGSAKHQAELHTLALLIALHRLRTLDIDALEEYPRESFDPKLFFLEYSRKLTFRDIELWDTDQLARDLHTLVTADKPGQLLPLKPMRDSGQFGARDEAHLAVLKVVLDAVFTVTSLGSPIVVDDHVVRSGYWIAPFGEIVTSEDSLARMFTESYEKAKPNCPAEEYRAFQMSVNGFIDLRPIGIVSSAKIAGDLVPGAVTIHRDAVSFATRLASLEPYSFFATCGLIAVVHRLRALGHLLSQARTDLGTMQDWLWTIHRDDRGHTYVIPGVVEALRMISEAQEKTTGTEWLDGIWGYERRLPKVRVEEIVSAVDRRKH